jgi:hypothetical protein
MHCDGVVPCSIPVPLDPAATEMNDASVQSVCRAGLERFSNRESKHIMSFLALNLLLGTRRRAPLSVTTALRPRPDTSPVNPRLRQHSITGNHPRKYTPLLACLLCNSIRRREPPVGDTVLLGQPMPEAAARGLTLALGFLSNLLHRDRVPLMAHQHPDSRSFVVLLRTDRVIRRAVSHMRRFLS